MKSLSLYPSRSSASCVKPIFHSFTLGPRMGYDSQRQHFALLIPTCSYLKDLTDPMQTPIDSMHTPTDPIVYLTYIVVCLCKHVYFKTQIGLIWAVPCFEGEVCKSFQAREFPISLTPPPHN